MNDNQRWTFWVRLSILAWLCFFFGALLYTVYPFGVVTQETAGNFYLATMDFHLFAPNALDWWRTIPVGAVLRAAMIFENPTGVVELFFIALFSIGILLTFDLGRALFPSDRRAFFLALALLLIEVLSMRTFFYSTQIAADTPYAHMLFIGSVLVVTGFLKPSMARLLMGYAVLGLAIFTRPTAIVLIFLFLPLAFIARRIVKERPVWIASLCTVLLLGPVSLWSARNYVLYGYFQPVAYGYYELMTHMLSFLDDTDHVLLPESRNAAFIRSVRLTEREVGTYHTAYFPWADREGHNEEKGVFAFLATLAGYPASQTLKLPWGNAQAMFDINHESLPIALKIMRLHFWSYIQTGMGNYVTLFTPSLEVVPSQQYQADAGLAYADIERRGASNVPALYPPHGRIAFVAPSLLLGQTLGLVCCSAAGIWLSETFGFLKFFLDHAIFLAALALLLLSRRFGKSKNYRAIRSASIVIIVLFLTAALNYAFHALVTTPVPRFTIHGEMGLHLTVLIAVFMLLPSISSRLSFRKLIAHRPSF